MLWLAMPEQTRRAVQEDMDWWYGLSKSDSALCRDMLAELRLSQSWLDLDRMYIFLPAVLVANGSKEHAGTVKIQAATQDAKTPGASDQNAGLWIRAYMS